MVKELKRASEMLIDECIQISYFMRGALTYEEALQRTPGERQRIGNFIEKRLEQEAKSPYPVY